MRDLREVQGFYAPFRQALVQPLLLGGAPRSFAILNGTLAATIAFAGAPLVGAAVGVIGHALGLFLARRDAQFLDVLARAMRIPDALDD